MTCQNRKKGKLRSVNLLSTTLLKKLLIGYFKNTIWMIQFIKRWVDTCFLRGEMEYLKGQILPLKFLSIK
jgi:hypothetical protein